MSQWILGSNRVPRVRGRCFRETRTEAASFCSQVTWGTKDYCHLRPPGSSRRSQETFIKSQKQCSLMTGHHLCWGLKSAQPLSGQPLGTVFWSLYCLPLSFSPSFPPSLPSFLYLGIGRGARRSLGLNPQLAWYSAILLHLLPKRWATLAIWFYSEDSEFDL